MIVPFPPGGPADTIARIVGQKMSEHWGEPVIIENRAGGNTAIGAELVAKSPPDGYTLLVAMDVTMVMNPLGDEESALRPAQGFRAGHPPDQEHFAHHDAQRRPEDNFRV